MEGDFTFSMDADCAVCHTNEGSSMDDTACLVGTANHESMTCLSCHDDEAALTEAHVSSNLSRYHRSPGLVPAISKRRYRE